MAFINLSTSITSCSKKLSTDDVCVKKLSICVVDTKNVSETYPQREGRRLYYIFMKILSDIFEKKS